MGTGSARLGPLSDCTANCRSVLSSERVPHRNKTATFRIEVIFGYKFQSILSVVKLLRLHSFMIKLKMTLADYMIHVQ
jgi:hypothetical protein